jgi:hypothetical protein
MTVAFVPLNDTELDPWLEPKFVPLIVTDVPTEPDVGVKAVIFGADCTLNGTPLLATPPAVTITFPPVAPAGTGTVIEASVQLKVGLPRPLKLTVPGLDPKLFPEMVTVVPTVPKEGEMFVITGTIVKFCPLLRSPATVTTTLPLLVAEGTGTVIDVAFQFVGVATTPLNVI